MLQSLKKIFDFNVMKFAKGEMGAVNGIAADGTIIQSNEQVKKVWTGTTFSVAALMLADGLKDADYRTAWGVYHVIYETKATGSGHQKRMRSTAISAPPCTCAQPRSWRWR
jgi:non-lysosomal glucosylceramidase